jgi:hypothetical protein
MEAILKGWDATNEVWVKVKVTSDGKLIVNPTAIFENPPTEDEANKGPSSEWAFDHAANASAHHSRYTDAESRSAIGDLLNSVGAAIKDFNMNYQSLNFLKYFNYRNSSGDTHNIGTTKPEDSNVLVMTCTQYGVGLVNMDIKIYNGSAYATVIRSDTFQAALAALLENPPTEDEDEKAPTSEWAFDHAADASAHHAKYTDLEACMAPYSTYTTITAGTYTAYDAEDKHYIVLLATSGDIHLKGLDKGTNGQKILFIKASDANDVTVYHNSGDAAAGDKIRTVSEADETISAGSYGAFEMVYQSSNWHMLRQL